MITETSRVEDIRQMNMHDGEMRLLQIETRYCSRDSELIVATFRDPRKQPEYPDFTIPVMYPTAWSAERVRMDLYAWLATMKAQYKRGWRDSGTALC